jgi:RNA polymerase-binding transcription factor DksA
MFALPRNDTFIQQQLLKRRGELTERRARVDADLEHGKEPLVADFADQAIQVQNDEALAAIGVAANAEVSAIDAALRRLKEGLYGICRGCGGEIAAARLQAVPHAVTCAACADI